MATTSKQMTTEEAWEKFGRWFCRRCADNGLGAAGEERFSMGVYAGVYCDPCWAADGRNHDRKFDPMDAGEHMEPEEY
jgi:hypothetical protein